MQMKFEHGNLESSITNTEICVCLGVAAATGVIAYVTLKVLFEDDDSSCSSCINEDDWFDTLLALVDKSVSELPEIFDLCDTDVVCHILLGFQLEGLLNLLNSLRFLLEQEYVLPDLTAIQALLTFLEHVDILKYQLYFTECSQYDTVFQIAEVCKETSFNLFRSYPYIPNPIIEAHFGVVNKLFLFNVFK